MCINTEMHNTNIDNKISSHNQQHKLHWFSLWKRWEMVMSWQPTADTFVILEWRGVFHKRLLLWWYVSAWGRQDRGGPRVGLMNLAIWVWSNFWSNILRNRFNSIMRSEIMGNHYRAEISKMYTIVIQLVRFKKLSTEMDSSMVLWDKGPTNITSKQLIST